MAKFTPLKISGAWLIESELYNDTRGDFREWFKADEIRNCTGIDFNPVQGNFSRSAKGVIRGIHFSKASAGQAKLVTCVQGRIMDVVVDVRPSSSTFGEWDAVDLSPSSGRSLLIDRDLGHAFEALENGSGVNYLLSSPYSPNEEFAVNPLDPRIGILWNAEAFSISLKDSLAPNLYEFTRE